MPSAADALSHAIESTPAAAGSAAHSDTWPWVFARCWMLLNRFDHGRRPTDLEAALVDFARLPADAPGRARLAAVLVKTQLRARTSERIERIERIERVEVLADIADTDPAPLPGWTADRSVVRAQWLLDALHQGSARVDPDDAVAEIERLAEVVGDAEPQATVIETMAVTALHLRTVRDRGLADTDAVVPRAEALRARLVPGSTPDLVARLIAAAQTAVSAYSRGDLAAAAAQVERLIELRGQIPADAPQARRITARTDQTVSSLQAPRGILDDTEPLPGPVAPETADPWTAHLDTPRRADRPGPRPADPATHLAELGGSEVRKGGPHLDDGVEHLRAAVDAAAEHDPRRVFYLTEYGGALVRRFELHHAGPDLDEGIRALEKARELAVDPTNPHWAHWARLCQMLGHAYRLLGRRPLDPGAGRDRAGGRSRSGPPQPSTAAATATARNAATGANPEANRGLDDDDAAGAVAALDTGRGPVPRSVTQPGDAAERRTVRGAPEPAQRWRRASRSYGGEKAPVDPPREAVRGPALPAHTAAVTASTDPTRTDRTRPRSATHWSGSARTR